MLSRRFSLFLLFLLLVMLAGEIVYFYWREHQPHEYPSFDPIIVSVAHDAGVDPFLIRALVWRESRFKPLTHGLADERGLMQVTPEAGERWAKANKIADFQPDNLYDPKTNIRAGTWYLARSMRLWSQTDDPVVFALAEYNAGRSNALKWVDPAAPWSHVAFEQRINFPGTHKYVEDIMTMRDTYRRDFADDPWYRAAAATTPAVTRTP